jgi:hypothetical protein
MEAKAERAEALALADMSVWVSGHREPHPSWSVLSL